MIPSAAVSYTHLPSLSHYDYLIVGAGLTSAVFAHEAKAAGKTCLVIDRRDHIGGNIYTEEIDGINEMCIRDRL